MEKQYNEEVIEAAYNRAISGENGEIIKDDLRFYADRISHTAGDTHATAYKEGERALALRILQLSGD